MESSQVKIENSVESQQPSTSANPSDRQALYQKKYELLLEKHQSVSTVNERLLHRISYIRKEIHHLRRLKEFFIHRLISYGDKFMEISLEIPDADPSNALEDSIFSAVCDEADKQLYDASSTTASVQLNSVSVGATATTSGFTATVAPELPQIPQMPYVSLPISTLQSPLILPPAPPVLTQGSLLPAEQLPPLQMPRPAKKRPALPRPTRPSRAKKPRPACDLLGAHHYGSKPQTPEVELSIEQIVESVATGQNMLCQNLRPVVSSQVGFSTSTALGLTTAAGNSFPSNFMDFQPNNISVEVDGGLAGDVVIPPCSATTSGGYHTKPAMEFKPATTMR